VVFYNQKEGNERRSNKMTTTATTTKKYATRYEAFMSKEMGDFLANAFKEAQRIADEKMMEQMKKRVAK
jgi:hypothetical protein